MLYSKINVQSNNKLHLEAIFQGQMEKDVENTVLSSRYIWTSTKVDSFKFNKCSLLINHI